MAALFIPAAAHGALDLAAAFFLFKCGAFIVKFLAAGQAQFKDMVAQTAITIDWQGDVAVLVDAVRSAIGAVRRR